MRVVVFPYNMGSQSAKALADALNVKRVYPDGKFVPKSDDVVINWGNSKPPKWNIPYGLTILNHMNKVNHVSNKLRAFITMSAKQVQIPEYTTDIKVAKDWIQNGIVVVERTILNGHSGEGIVLHAIDPTDAGSIDSYDDWYSDSKLFTKYVKKKDEFRVHVFDGKIIDVAQKKLAKGVENAEYKVRNHKGGWIYARADIKVPHDVLDQAYNAIDACGLDFGAVDIGYNYHHEKATVYEVNTAPGLHGTTLYNYAAAFAAKYGLPLTIEKPEVDFDVVAVID